MAYSVYRQLPLHLLLITAASSIHKGQVAHIERYKSIVQIYDPKYVCAGTLISARFVLTAAHCYRIHARLEPLSVRAGELKILPSFKGIPVLAMERHPKYNALKMQHDIAVLRLQDAIMYTARIGYTPICSKRLKTAAVLQVAGWNTQNMSWPLSSTSISIVAQSQCETSLEAVLNEVPTGLLCGQPDDGTGLCYGDSGNPLIFNNEVCGLAMAMQACGSSELPDIYTDVFSNQDFITNAILNLDQRAKKAQKRFGN